MRTTAERAAAIGLPWDHTEYVCDGNHIPGRCMFCDGGLFACSVCDSFEGATTTQCPGVKMTGEQADMVYNGELDYRHGQWIEAESFYCPGGYEQLLTEDEKAAIAHYDSRRNNRK